MKTLVHKDQELIETIIRRCDICFAGVVTPENTPYVIPMNFGYQNGIIYLHSAPTGRVITALENNAHICITFSTDHELAFQHPQVACSYRMKSKSVIAFGQVTFIEDMDQKREALNIIMEQYSDKQFEYSDPAVRNVKIWAIPIDEISCKEFGAPHEKYKKS
ncbi:pyridoxamine 5'-phosphate oxidase family protein [Geofilum rubicundum]|uniref:Pyridoxamine 5'-phosphate oxidase-related, FMN-binding n=1 Tax=Geofilum rubicundum JCM 15548 TaxID=1236989 RepID=A0A0E9LS83_9BACT|nr:pyridoxamine 5'-phosphate oxidase family protein [Geofilum rubicundum]GAO28427.1 pyridoxamine 5'-phosphate oxidase-related, FMN-binding [Geofilum rubicundum JCM 15548]